MSFRLQTYSGKLLHAGDLCNLYFVRLSAGDRCGRSRLRSQVSIPKAILDRNSNTLRGITGDGDSKDEAKVKITCKT